MDDEFGEMLLDAAIDGEAIVAAESEDKHVTIGKFIDEQLALENEVAGLERLLEDAKARWSAVAELKLPKLFDELGLKEWKMQDGRRMVLKRTLYASTDPVFKEQAVAWTEEQGFHGIITTTLELPYERNEEGRARAKKVYEVFKLLGIEDARLNSSIHHSTLSAFIREYEGLRAKEQADRELDVRLKSLPEAYPAFPPEFFKINRIFKTEVKEGRKTK